MLKISHAGCPGLVTMVQFAFEMCLAAKNRQIIHKNPYFSVQSHPMSLLSVPIERLCTTSY